jgi:hypothetical protein
MIYLEESLFSGDGIRTLEPLALQPDQEIQIQRSGITDPHGSLVGSMI